ncbi:MAG: biopolymer transporter ExbD [Sphingomonas sp.]
MAMSVGDSTTETPMSDINTTPLVDVMLVLLIIFLITVPVVAQTVKMTLPKVRFEPTITKPENVSLSVVLGPKGCQVYWGMMPVNSGQLLDLAQKKLKTEVDRQGGPNVAGLELPEVHIRGDINTPYRCIGGAIFAMQMAGFQKVGFISEPEPGQNATRF